MRISILGYYGVPNTGDEAILAGILQKLRAKFPGASIRVSARDQFYVRRMHAVDTYPLERKIPAFLAVMSQSDLLLVGGGGLLFDMPFQVLPFWLGRIVMARCIGTPPILYSVGVGPITKRRSRLYLRSGLRFARIISVRDKSSANLLKECGIRGDILLLPDPALLLLPASQARAKEILREEGIPDDGCLKVGISLRYWQAFDRSEQLRFLSEVAKAMDKLAKRYDVSFILMPFQYPPALGDVGLMVELASSCGCKGNIHIVRGQYAPEEVKALLGQMDLTLGMRLHSLIFSLTMAVPCVALSYTNKVASFMESFESKDFCLPLKAVTEENIVSLVEEAIEHRGYHSDRLRAISARIVKEVDGLHDSMLARIDGMV
ncbi:MAG: polysaccharide pyruvyl transferase family protein [Thermoplasmata archaeon]